MKTKFSDLTPEQDAAVRSKARVVVLTAGAGTGKTTTLVARYLAAVGTGLDAGQSLESALAEVLAVTFTRKAAREIRRRASAALAARFPGSEGLVESAPISTIDSLAARLLRIHGAAAGIDPGFRVLDEIEAKVRFRMWAREAMEEPGMPVVEADRGLEVLLDHAYAVITQARAQGVEPEAFVKHVGAGLQAGPPSPEGQLIARLYRVLDGRLRAGNLFDFPRLLFELDRLLVTRGEFLPTYREVLVDEYQDTTPLQERVLRRLASGTYFAVGDAKQAIYRFRGAAPRHLAALASLPGAERLSLTRNFRSTLEILDGINRMFADPLAPYEPLRSDTAAGRPGIEILPSVSKEAEPGRVVRRVRALLAAGRTPGQIAVLLRSPRTHGLAFERAFREAKIPFVSSGGGGYYDRPEVRDLVALLRAVRNPLDDQALVRVLRGPLYRVPNSALAEAAALRARAGAEPARPLFTVLDRDAHPAARRAGAFLAQMTAESRRLDLPGLIHALLRDSGYQGYLQTIPADARIRMEANLRKFYVLAEAFAGRHLFTGLEEFLDYVVEVGRQETVESEAPPDTAGGEDEALRIMSVHQAKGLEFPVVIVAGLSDRVFPKQHRADPGWRFTAGLPAEAGGGLRENSDPEVKKAEQSAHDAEEIRLLYVAMTRARETLILSGVPGDNSFTAGIWPWLCTVTGDIRPEFAALVEDGRHLELPFVTSPSPFQGEGGGEGAERPEVIESAFSRIAAAYPPPAPADPGSLTVSMLASYALCPLQYRYRYVLRLPADPGVDGSGASEGVDEALLGTILHRTLEEYVREKKRLGSLAGVGAASSPPASPMEWLTARFMRVCEGFGVGGGDALRAYARQALPALEHFPGSPYDRPPSEIRDVEAPFALVLSRVGAGLAPAPVVIRGALDRLDRVVVAGVGATSRSPVVDEVIDYKSNRREEPERYRFALSLYGLAAERIFGCRSPKLTLLYLRTGHAVSVPPDPGAEARALSLAGGIRAGEFPARPGPECGYCPYRKLCPSAPVWARRRPLRRP